MSVTSLITTEYQKCKEKDPNPALDPSTVEEKPGLVVIPYLVSSMFLFYCAVSGNFIDTLAGRGMQRALQKRWMKHLVGLFIITFTISFVSDTSAWTTLGYGFGLYVWFLLSTKMSFEWNIAIFLILAAGFFMKELLKKDYHERWESKAKWQHEQQRRRNVRSTMEEAVRICFISVIAITIVGNVIYSRKKWVKHGGSLDSLGAFIWNYIYL